MSNAALMEAALHLLLPDLQEWHRMSRNRAFKKKVEQHIKRIHEALGDAPQQ